jgi:P-type E1-E2 ATPase
MLEFTKMFITFRIEQDVEMYDDVLMETARCLDSTIHEELGDIDYFFTDKTGTLTSNVLTFQGCSTGGKIYEIQHNKAQMARKLKDEIKVYQSDNDVELS